MKSIPQAIRDDMARLNRSKAWMAEMHHALCEAVYGMNAEASALAEAGLARAVALMERAEKEASQCQT